MSPNHPSAALRDLYSTLREDVDALGGGFRLSTGQIAFPGPGALDPKTRRALVRAIFAFVEGVTFGLKYWAVHTDSGARPITEEERFLATERLPDLDEKGRVIVRVAQLRLQANVRFAFSLYAAVYAPGFQLEVSDRGWEALRKAAQVRNRLMHPKSAGDLRVEDQEIRDSLTAFVWYEHELVRVLRNAVEVLEDLVGAAKIESAALRARLESQRKAIGDADTQSES